jgi:acyl-CoA dehydrogenase
MSDTRNLLLETATGLFSDVRDAEYEKAWQLIAHAGFGSLLVSEEAGGFGGDWGDAFEVLRVAGGVALPLPIGEWIVGAHLIAKAGFAIGEGAIGFASRAEGAVEHGRFIGTLARVPCGRHARAVVTALERRLVVVDATSATIECGYNAADEPRDTLRFNGASAQVSSYEVDLVTFGAFIRAAQAAGALDAALSLTIEYVNGRIQFGKPLAKLQAVQQSLAMAACETAAANAATRAAAAALERGDATFEIAAAKLRTNIAIGSVTSIVHQAHGAIGFTQEYPLHRFTRRLMAWRSECGSDRYWSERLGSTAVDLGGRGLWADITRRTDYA